MPISNRKRRPAGRRAVSKGRLRAGQVLSLLVPILVLALVVALIVWVVLTQEKRRTGGAALRTDQPESVSAQAGSGTDLVPVVTAQPLNIPGPDVPRITVQEAKQLLDSQKAVLVDVRDASLYAERHAAGAISIPAPDIAARVGELPSDKGWIFYCT